MIFLQATQGGCFQVRVQVTISRNHSAPCYMFWDLFSFFNVSMKVKCEDY